MDDSDEQNQEDGDNWDEPESPDGDTQHQEELDNVVREECLQTFRINDYIMEPDVFTQLKRYFKAGGNPEPVIQLLSENYTAVAQTANLLAEWLIQSGVDVKEVQDMVERHLHSMIIKYFDPKKADSIFTVAGEVPSWLYEMVEFPTWRNLFYRLAESHPDCLLLNFTVKLISDAGYQGEIMSVSTACHQLEVFTRVLRTSISSLLAQGVESNEKNITEFAKMVCHGEHTYLYSQVLMNVLCQEPKGGSNVRRICQEVHKYAQERGLDVTPITLALSGAAAYPRACQALSSMLSRNALNPADVTVLFRMYTSPDPPPVEMIRNPQFLDLFIDVLFKPGSKINPEHKPKYIQLVSYASSVAEVWKKGVRKSISRDELKTTTQALERAHNLCLDDKGYTELLADVATLFQCIKVQVVAKGVLRWVYHTVSEPSYFRLNTDHTPLHLVLLDEISSNHILLHREVFALLTEIFERPFEELDVLVRLNLKKILLDRMVHLLSCGHVIPITTYIHTSWLKGDTDISLIRYFATEVLDIIAPPYTAEFVLIFYPLIESEDITGTLRSSAQNDPVSEFIRHCKASHNMS